MNLEPKIYELSFKLSEAIDKNNLQKLLGVLSNDGVYAMWVYAMDKLDWKFSKDIEEMKKMKFFRLMEVISNLSEFSSEKLDYVNVLKEIATLSAEIDKLNQELKNMNENNQEKRNKEHEKKEKEKNRGQILNKYFQNLAQDLNKLLFMKELLEKVFIYALYHAKAKGDKE
jgi:uncharacterized membrane protein YgaE (UPF0421/DUF939 family)